MKQMTEAQAFRKVARIFAGGKRMDPKHGICLEVYGIEKRGGLSQSDGLNARCRAIAHVTDPSGYAYGFDYQKWEAHQNDEARALACLWMALEAEEEARCAR